jgi:hypothetical protein
VCVYTYGHKWGEPDAERAATTAAAAASVGKMCMYNIQRYTHTDGR